MAEPDAREQLGATFGLLEPLVSAMTQIWEVVTEVVERTPRIDLQSSPLTNSPGNWRSG